MNILSDHWSECGSLKVREVSPNGLDDFFDTLVIGVKPVLYIFGWSNQKILCDSGPKYSVYSGHSLARIIKQPVDNNCVFLVIFN